MNSGAPHGTPFLSDDAVTVNYIQNINYVSVTTDALAAPLTCV